jgi:uncharacterized protein YifN (PemK superfamily)
MSKLILKLFTSATAILCLNACLIIPGGKVPKINESHFDDFQPNLSINFQIIDKMDDETIGVDEPYSVDEVDDMFIISNLFSTNEAPKGTEDYHFKIIKNTNGLPTVQFAMQAISWLTLGLIPTYAKDEFEYIIKVIKDKEELKTYKYKDHTTTLGGIYFIFNDFGEYPWKIIRNRRNSILAFLKDFEKDVRTGNFTK